MKKILLFLALTPSVLFADNLFKNSDMSINDGWKGDGIYKPESDGEIGGDSTNIVRVLKAQPHKAVTFSQIVNISKVKYLLIKFRYKSVSGTDGILELQSRVYSQPYPQSCYPTLKIDGNWHSYQTIFSNYDKVPRVEFSFTLYAGNGTFLFDDITVEPVESMSYSGTDLKGQ